MLLFLKPFKQFFIIASAFIGFYLLGKKQGADKQRMEQNENASKIMGRQRDVNISSVADADKLFKDADNRN